MSWCMRSVADHVDARVPDVAHHVPGFGKQERRDRAPHAQFVPFGSRPLENGAIGIAQGVRDAVVRVGRFQIVEVRELVAHHLHGHLARDFPRRVSTHPVRDYEQPAIRVGRSVERVLITLSNSADISASRNSKVH